MASPSKVIVVDLSSAENHAAAAVLIATALGAEAATLKVVDTHIEDAYFKGQRALSAVISLSPDAGALTQGNTAVGANSYTVLLSDEVILATAAALQTITLPTAASAEGRTFTFKKLDAAVANTVIEGDAAETIDGAANQAMTTQYDSLAVYSDGTDWHIV